MKRSEFLKRLAAGVVAIPLARVTNLHGPEEAVYPEPKDPEYSLSMAKALYSREKTFADLGWPIRINDIVCINDSDNKYLVTAIFGGEQLKDGEIVKPWAELTPLAYGERIYATPDDNIIRFANAKSQL